MGWKTLKEHYNIEHAVQVTSAGLCIGSPYIHNLITITPDDIVTCKSGIRGNSDLRRYWDDFHDNIEGLRRIIEQEDRFDRTIPVYTYADGVVLEKHCEEIGWPNVTHDGLMMYENMFFTDPKKAASACLESAQNGVEYMEENVERKAGELAEAKALLAKRVVVLELAQSA